MLKKINESNIPLFSLLFITMIVLIYSNFIFYQKTFIWEGDGFYQHYLVFQDYLERLTDLLRGSENGFQLWDWNNGLGADVIISYGYYVIGDPFVYLGLLFPSNMTEIAYNLLIIIRMFFVGVSFLLYCSELRINKNGALIGSIVYTFSHFVLLNVIRHPFFLLPMILLPLLCLGIERILKNKSPVTFTFVVFLSAFSNFYFFYMLTIIVFIFALVRFHDLNKRNGYKNIVKYMLRASYSYIIGLMMSCVLFLPMVYGVLQSSRSTDDFTNGLKLYPLNYYKDLMRLLFTSGSNSWTVLGVSSFVLLLLPMLFRKKKEFSYITNILSIFGVMLLFPAIGSAMNGFSGAYNRWTFAIPFFLSLGTALLYNKRFDLEMKDIKIMGITIVVYFLIILNGISDKDIPYRYIFSMLFALIYLILFYLSVRVGNKNNHNEVLKRALSLIFLFFIIGNSVVSAVIYYYPWTAYDWGGNKIDEMLEQGTFDSMYINSFSGAENHIPKNKEEIFRIGSTSKGFEVRNEMLYLQRMGINSYFSITNGNIANFASKLESGQYQTIMPLTRGIDDRRRINNILGVRYILTEKENANYLPYGYNVIKNVENGDKSFVIAETNSAYPFAYVNPFYINSDTFDDLNPIEREVALTEAVVINPENVPSNLVKEFNNISPIKTIKYELVLEDKNILMLEKNKLRVKDNKGKLILLIKDNKELESSEIFVYVKGIRYYPENTDILTNTPSNFSATIQMNDIKKSIYQPDRLSFTFYVNRNNMLFNLGYISREDTPENIIIELDKSGEYALKDIIIYALPLNEEEYLKNVEDKYSNEMEIDKFTSEEIRGIIKGNISGVLTTTIPYTDGWKVEVDGEKVDTLLVNEGFIGVPVEKGQTSLVFRYRTPYLILGGIISVLGVSLYALDWIKYKTRILKSERIQNKRGEEK